MAEELYNHMEEFNDLSGSPKLGGFNFFFPGQCLKEFAPELQHDLVDYPNDNNTGMQDPAISGGELAAPGDKTQGDLSLSEVDLPPGVLDLDNELNRVTSGYVSTSPAGGAGIGRDGKPQVLDGVPLRKEDDIRGPMFTDEFYQNTMGVPGKYLTTAKLAGLDDKGQLFSYLKGIVGEIAAAFVAVFKATNKKVLNGMPGNGEVNLVKTEDAVNEEGSQIKELLERTNDGDLRDAINDATAQAAVWSNGNGGYTYEVFVRAETIDRDTMVMKYSFVTGTKGI